MVLKTNSRGFAPSAGTVVTLVAASMLNCMGGAAVSTALPLISEAFPETSDMVISLIMALPSLGVVITGLFIGAIADRFGKAKTLAISLVLFTVAGLSGMAASSMEMLLVGRFVMGIGMGGVTTSSTALVADYFSGEKQTRVLGMQSAAIGLGILVMNTIGGMLALGGWRAPFAVYASGIILIILLALFVREPAPRGDASEPDGASSEDGPVGESPDKADRSAGSRGVIAMCFFFTFVTLTMNFIVPSKTPYLVAEFGGDSVVTGLFLGATGIASMLASLSYARIVPKVGARLLLVIGFALNAIGMLLMGIAWSLWLVILGGILVNVGAGFMIPLIANMIADASTPADSGRNMSFYAVAMNLGQFCAPLWSGALAVVTGLYSSMFYVGALVCVATIIGVVVIRKR